MPTHDDKIILIDTLIERERKAMARANATGQIVDPAVCETLKEIAADLRARAPGAAETTRRIIGEKVAAIVRSPNQTLGYQSGKLIALGQEVVGRWRTIEAALEQADDEVEPDGDDYADRAEWKARI